MPTDTTSASDKPKRYHWALVALHWLVALLIFGAFFLVQGNEDGGERFRPGQGNLPGQNFQQGNPPAQGFQQGNPPQIAGGDDDEAPPANFQPQIVPGSQPQQGSPQGGFPQQRGGQGILSTIGFHMIFGITVLLLLIVRLIVRWTTKHPEWQSAGNKFFDWVGVLTHWGLYLLTFAMVITGIVLADQRGQLARTFGIGSVPTRGSFGKRQFQFGYVPWRRMGTITPLDHPTRRCGVISPIHSQG